MTVEETVELAKQNINKSVASGNIPDSKYILEHNSDSYKSYTQYRKSLLRDSKVVKQEAEEKVKIEEIKAMMMRFAESRGEVYKDDPEAPITQITLNQTPPQQTSESEADTPETP